MSLNRFLDELYAPEAVDTREEEISKLASAMGAVLALEDSSKEAMCETGSSWMAQFEGTPFFPKAVQIMEEELQSEMSSLQSQMANRQAYAQQDAAYDQRRMLDIKKKQLELESAKARIAAEAQASMQQAAMQQQQMQGAPGPGQPEGMPKVGSKTKTALSAVEYGLSTLPGVATGAAGAGKGHRVAGGLAGGAAGALTTALGAAALQNTDLGQNLPQELVTELLPAASATAGYGAGRLVRWAAPKTPDATIQPVGNPVSIGARKASSLEGEKISSLSSMMDDVRKKTLTEYLRKDVAKKSEFVKDKLKKLVSGEGSEGRKRKASKSAKKEKRSAEDLSWLDAEPKPAEDTGYVPTVDMKKLKWHERARPLIGFNAGALLAAVPSALAGVYVDNALGHHTNLAKVPRALLSGATSGALTTAGGALGAYVAHKTQSKETQLARAKFTRDTVRDEYERLKAHLKAHPEKAPKLKKDFESYVHAVGVLNESLAAKEREYMRDHPTAKKPNGDTTKVAVSNDWVRDHVNSGIQSMRGTARQDSQIGRLYKSMSEMSRRATDKYRSASDASMTSRGPKLRDAIQGISSATRQGERAQTAMNTINNFYKS